MRFIRTTTVLIAFGAAAALAAHAQKPQPPLAQFVSQRIVVMPLQLLRPDTGAFVGSAAWGAFRKELDDSIGSAIAERGVGKKWMYAADVARSAKRNAAYVSDPYSLGAQPLRGAIYKGGDKIPEVFAGNLRSLIAIGDTRFALVPVELGFVRKGAQQWAVLRLALIDGRGNQFVWVGDVASDPGTSFTPALINSLAARVADLVVAP